MSKKNRCTGHCCKNFSLPYSPEELMDKYHRWLVARSSRPDVIPMNGAKDLSDVWDPDIHIIAPMCIYLGPDASSPHYVNNHEKGPDIHRYRCKHWNQKTGDCTIYEIRPQMCRVYPGRDGCNFAACTWKSRKRKKRPKLKDPRPIGGLNDKLEKPK